MILQERIDRHTRAATGLALLSDQQLSAFVDRSPVVGSGIGGTSLVLDVDGVRVFVKRIRLTDLERRPENVMSTRNLFDLPVFCQYGVGSPGFGAWRELAANVMTTNWVLAGRTESFPLLHHWRVLPESARTPGDASDVDDAVAYWNGSPAMRRRLDALTRASASVVLFLEHIPHTLTEWLRGRTAPDVSATYSHLETQLLTAVEFMNANGLTHFDAHFGNVLTDGRQLYLADLGLANSPHFDLSSDETAFLRLHRTHDVGYAVMRLVNWLVTSTCGVDSGDAPARNERIRAYAAGVEPDVSSAVVAEQIRLNSPVAAVMNDFYGQLFTVSRATPYPADEIARALRAAGRT